MGELTVARAEEIARGLVDEDEAVRDRAWREVDQLARFGLRMGEQLFEVAKDRLGAQLRTRSADTLDVFLERLGDLLSGTGGDETHETADDSISVVASESPPSIPTVPAPPTIDRRSDATRSGAEATKMKKAKPDKRAKQAKQAAPEPTAPSANHSTHGKPKAKKHKQKETEPVVASGEQPPIRVLALAKEPGSDDEP